LSKLKQRSTVEPLRIADATRNIRHVFVRDYVLPCDIGVHDHEREQSQRVRINLDLAVSEGEEPLRDQLHQVFCYEDLVATVQMITSEGHINLVETLADRIANTCLQDARCRSIRIRIEKLDVFDQMESVGVEIERYSPLPPTN